MVGGLERLEKVDNVGVRAEAKVDAELLGAFVDGKGGGASDGCSRLGDDLDGNHFVSYKILCLEDHAERAMVEGRYSFISSIEHNTLVKLIAHALHRGSLLNNKRGSAKGIQRYTRWLRGKVKRREQAER